MMIRSLAAALALAAAAQMLLLPASAEVDRIVVDAVTADRLGDMLVVSDERAAEAAIDGLWQAIMLEGVRRRTPLRGEFLSYEAPTYYGMIVAAYRPNTEESLGTRDTEPR